MFSVKNRKLDFFRISIFLTLTVFAFLSSAEVLTKSSEDRIMLVEVESIKQFRFDNEQSIPKWVDENLLPLICGQEVYASQIRNGGDGIKSIKINAFLDEFCISHRKMSLRPSFYLVNIAKRDDGFWLKDASPVIYIEGRKIYVESPGWLSFVKQDLVSEVPCTDKTYIEEGVSCYTLLD